MLAGWEAFQVIKPIVGWVAIFVMNVTPGRNVSKCHLPNIAMHCLAAASVIRCPRPHAIEAAIEILCDNVKDDWINEPFVRDSADFHPLAVLNK
jgi:hypothetical protein